MGYSYGDGDTFDIPRTFEDRTDHKYDNKDSSGYLEITKVTGRCWCTGGGNGYLYCYIVKAVIDYENKFYSWWLEQIVGKYIDCGNYGSVMGTAFSKTYVGETRAINSVWVTMDYYHNITNSKGTITGIPWTPPNWDIPSKRRNNPNPNTPDKGAHLGEGIGRNADKYLTEVFCVEETNILNDLGKEFDKAKYRLKKEVKELKRCITNEN